MNPINNDSVENGINSRGFGSKALGGLKDGFGKTKGFASRQLDRPEFASTPEKRKMWRVVYDVGLIALVVILGSATFWMGGGFPAQIANISLMQLMGLPMLLSGAGFAVSLLLEEFGVSNTARKAMAVVLPILIAATASLIIYSGFHAGVFAPNSMSFPTIIGIMMAPLALVGVGWAIDSVSEKTRTPLGPLTQEDRERGLEDIQRDHQLERQVQRNSIELDELN